MLKQLSRFGPLGALMLYILNWVLKLKYILYPHVDMTFFKSSELGLFRFPDTWIQYALAHPLVYTIFSIHTIYLFALFVNFSWKQEKLTYKNSLLPAVSIVIISSVLPSGFLFSIYTIVVMLIVGVIRLIFSSSTLSGSNLKLYYAGILMGCVIMLKPSFILLALAMMIIISIIKAVNPKSILAYLFGLLLPYYVFRSLIWIFAPALIKKITSSIFILPKGILWIEAFILTIISILWLIFHTTFLKQSKSEIGGIQVIKKWISLRIIWLVILITSIFALNLPSSAFFVFINISAMIVFQCFNIVLNKKWANFTFVFLILVIILNQYVFTEM